MGRLFLLLLVVSGLVVAYLSVMQPSRLRRLSKNVRTVAYAYVAAVLIGAVLRLVFGWGT